VGGSDRGGSGGWGWRGKGGLGGGGFLGVGVVFDQGIISDEKGKRGELQLGKRFRGKSALFRVSDVRGGGSFLGVLGN